MSKNWAICIGINEYHYLPSLQYAVRDAAAVRDFFLKEVDFEEVFYFSDDSPPIETSQGHIRSQPTHANLLYFFRKRFQHQFLSVEDNFWFFFAGHGELHEGHDYLMPMDVDPENLERTALRISDITASLRNSGADNTVLLLDACRSERLDEGQRSAMGFGSEAQPGIVTIYACSPGQSSYEIKELKHGAFTHTLLEGFRLQGANSCATVQRIDQYLRHQVPSLNQLYQKRPQTPYTAVEPLSKNYLILLPARARLEDVQVLKLEAHKAENQNEWDFAQQLWVRILAASKVDQDAILALQRIALKREQPSLAALSLFPATDGLRGIESPMSEPSSPSESGELFPQEATLDFPSNQANASPPQLPKSRLSQSSKSKNTALQTSFTEQDSPISKEPFDDPFISRRRAIQTLGAFSVLGLMLLGGRSLLSSSSSSVDNEGSNVSKGRNASFTGPKDSPSPPQTASKFEFEVIRVDAEGRVTDREQRSVEYRKEGLRRGVSLDLVMIPGGTFQMGSASGQGDADERPQHQVTVKPFLMGKYPVTQAQWRVVSAFPKVRHDLSPAPSNFAGDSRPVEQVSWDDAVEFCNRLSKYTNREYRLPSEAEWEFACRAGTNTAFHFGQKLTPTLAQCKSNFGMAVLTLFSGQTAPVGSFSANAFGIYDMHGNVGEWCLDHWHENYEGAPTDGSAWISDRDFSKRLLRGGSWDVNPTYCRSAERNRSARGNRYDVVGFRVVGSLPVNS
jgi:formylglycine-generating enzyme required for sulfatase activity/uncharacterized caspase-like protein